MKQTKEHIDKRMKSRRYNQEMKEEIFDEEFNKNRKEMDKCIECKCFARGYCKKHTIIDQFLREKIKQKYLGEGGA